MRQLVARSPARLVIGQLAEVIVKALRAAPVKPGPKSRLANRNAPGHHHRQVIIRDPAHHVRVRLYVAHGLEWLTEALFGL